MLNPNCSEIVARLNGQEFSVCTDTFPNDCLLSMIEILEDTQTDNSDLEYVDNAGGGGDWAFVEAVLPIALKVVKGKISREKGEYMERRCWEGEPIEKETQQTIE